ncbi:MAG: 2-oxoacid:acceptor oxidoreductase family protein [Chloroflexota bacterium]|nr:2-oxoacid:acceptor oxidoreductase family protein [Chloroflexota bacterium]
MTTSDHRKVEVRFAGVGGAGLLTAGQVLVWGAFPLYPHVSWCPSYTIAVRGGGSESTVILSHEEIYSPITDKTEDLVMVTPSKLKNYEDSVRPGGLMILESTGLEDDVVRNDIRVVKVPALQMAMDLGDLRISNFALLGAYIGVTGAISAELIVKEIERRFSKSAKVLEQNREAFNLGLKHTESIVSG